MPRIDGYPAADPLTGSEVLPGEQGGATTSFTVDQFTAHVQALLTPMIAQQIASMGAVSSEPSGDDATILLIL